MKVVLWDLDSTLCGTLHRQGMVPDIRAGRATWDEYSMLCTGDAPIEGSVALARFIDGQNGLIEDQGDWVHQFAVSGRSDEALDLTMDWLARHDVPLSRAYLRPKGDRTENGLYKVMIIEKLRAEGWDVVMLIDDWAETAEVVTAKTGVPVLVVKGAYAGDVKGSA